MRPIGRVFKQLPRDPASVNAMKQACVIVFLAYFSSFEQKTLLKPLKMSISLHWISLNKMALAVNFRMS